MQDFTRFCTNINVLMRDYIFKYASNFSDLDFLLNQC